MFIASKSYEIEKHPIFFIFLNLIWIWKKHLQNSSLEILEIFRFWSLEIWKNQILKPQILKPWNLKKSDFEASTSKKNRIWRLKFWKNQILTP